MPTLATYPESGRLIKVKGSDCFGDFTCVGKFVLYKGQKKGRFMRQDKFGIWIVDRNTWADAENWEYVSELEKSEKG